MAFLRQRRLNIMLMISDRFAYIYRGDESAAVF